MRTVFESIVLVMLIASTAFVLTHAEYVRTEIHTIMYGAPCERTVTYTITSIDPRFNLSTSSVRAEVDRAVSAWNTVSGKELLAYATSGARVSIHFVYDKRQQTTEQLNSLQDTLNSDNAKYADLKNEYVTMNTLYEQNKKDFDAHTQTFTAAQEQYEREVASWNAKGGAPSDVYTTLEHERVQLTNTAQSLRKEAALLNARADELRTLSLKIQGSAATHNADAHIYNTLNASAGEEFDEGEFVTNGQSEDIFIYEYPNEHKLVRVLEHELGHAIGLAHVTETDAVMYSFNSGSSNMPTIADITELTRVCGKDAVR